MFLATAMVIIEARAVACATWLSGMAETTAFLDEVLLHAVASVVTLVFGFQSPGIGCQAHGSGLYAPDALLLSPIHSHSLV
jgi:hypothetical protein